MINCLKFILIKTGFFYNLFMILLFPIILNNLYADTYLGSRFFGDINPSVSTRLSSMGNTGITIDYKSTALQKNPAGLGLAEKYSINLSMRLFILSEEVVTGYDDNGSEDIDANSFINAGIDSAGTSFKLGKNIFIALAYYKVSDFRYKSKLYKYSGNTKIAKREYTIKGSESSVSAGIGIGKIKWLAIGIGVNLLFKWKRSTDLISGLSSTNIELKNKIAFNINTGIILSLGEYLKLGYYFRSPYKVKEIYIGTSTERIVKMPFVMGTGLSLHFKRGFDTIVAFDIVYRNWSKLRVKYNTGEWETITENNLYLRNTFEYSIGAEHLILFKGGKIIFPIRYGMNVLPYYLYKKYEKVFFTLGTGYHINIRKILFKLDISVQLGGRNSLGDTEPYYNDEPELKNRQRVQEFFSIIKIGTGLEF